MFFKVFLRVPYLIPRLCRYASSLSYSIPCFSKYASSVSILFHILADKFNCSKHYLFHVLVDMRQVFHIVFHVLADKVNCSKYHLLYVLADMLPAFHIFIPCFSIYASSVSDSIPCFSRKIQLFQISFIPRSSRYA